MTKVSGDYFGPVNVCIYCVSNDPPLTDEHIIPESFGGNIILENASCQNCQRTINEQFEQSFAQMFRSVRYKRGIGKRRKNKRPKVLTVMILKDQNYKERGGGSKLYRSEFRKEDISYEDHPGFFAMPILQRPGIMRDLEPHESYNEPEVGWFTSMKPTSKTGIYDEVRINLLIFMRELAKIAHGYASLKYGVDGYERFMPEIVLGKNIENINHYIGSAPDLDGDTDQNYIIGDVEFSHRLGINLIVVVIKIFPHENTPSYQIVVGRRKDEISVLKGFDPVDHLVRERRQRP